MENITHERYDGVLYQIEYKPELSIRSYTQRAVYHIKTDEENYLHAKKVINSLIAKSYGYKAEDVWSKGEYLAKNKTNPSMVNALHIHYNFSYDEDEDIYVYVFIRPYDD